MRKIICTGLILMMLSFSISSLAQVIPPPPNNGNGSPSPEHNTPVGGGAAIGGGLIILITLGAAYGSKKVYDFKKSNKLY